MFFTVDRDEIFACILGEMFVYLRHTGLGTDYSVLLSTSYMKLLSTSNDITFYSYSVFLITVPALMYLILLIGYSFIDIMNFLLTLIIVD